jgi:hypothetical protein
MIGMLSQRGSKLPNINLPVGDYTSYRAEVGKDGYRIDYKGNDPTVMRVERDKNVKAGFLGLGNNKITVVEEYAMDGAHHQGGPTSNARSWQDDTNGGNQSGKLTAQQVECIEAVGGGKQTGRVVGTSVGAAVAPAVMGIPFVGWLAAGWVAMFGGNQGAEIGGNMASELSDVCEDPDFAE